MKTTQQFTAIIGREGNGYVALRPELDIAAKAILLSKQKVT